MQTPMPVSHGKDAALGLTAFDHVGHQVCEAGVVVRLSVVGAPTSVTS